MSSYWFGYLEELKSSFFGRIFVYLFSVGVLWLLIEYLVNGELTPNDWVSNISVIFIALFLEFILPWGKDEEGNSIDFNQKESQFIEKIDSLTALSKTHEGLIKSYEEYLKELERALEMRDELIDTLKERVIELESSQK